MTTALLVLAGLGFLALLYAGRGYWAWVSALGLVLAAWWQAGVQSPTAFMTTAGLVIAAALVGAALSGSGVIFQGLFRNPLVEPYIIGASSGAARSPVTWVELWPCTAFLGGVQK